MEKVRIREGKNSDQGSGINIPDPQHCVLYLSARVAVLRPSSAVVQIKILKFFDVDPGWKKFGSGMENGSGINIPDPQHCVLYLSARVAVLRPPSAVAQPDELRQVGPNKKR